MLYYISFAQMFYWCLNIKRINVYCIIKFFNKAKLKLQMRSSANSPKTMIKMSIKCESLNKIFYKQRLDSFAMIKLEKWGKQFETVFKSQVVESSFDPSYDEEIYLQHSFQENQRYIFQVLNANNLSVIGETKVNIKELLTAPGGALIKELGNGFKKGGKIIINFSLCNKNRQFLMMKMKAMNLVLKNWLSWLIHDKVYFKMNEIKNDQKQVLYVSQRLPYSSTIQWKQFQIKSVTTQKSQSSRLRVELCRGQVHHEEIIAQSDIEWEQLPKIRQFDVFGNNKNTIGHFVIENFIVERRHSFEEYIKSGLEMSLMIGIDFSASNKPPTHHDSLHYVNKGDNLYLKCLQAIASGVIDYGVDHRVPVYAIGTKVKHPKMYTGEVVQQCFPINADHENPHINGIEQIKTQYKKLLQFLQFSGPTHFSDIIKNAVSNALRSKKTKESFTVLLILSDGKINDKEQVKALLQECATLPIYIIFLIMQNDDHELHDLKQIKMEVYTSDKNLAERENMVNIEVVTKESNIAKIGRNALKNLPDVVSKYMALRKKTPQLLQKTISKKTKQYNPEI